MWTCGFSPSMGVGGALVGPQGFEPWTEGLKVLCSTAELRARIESTRRLDPRPQGGSVPPSGALNDPRSTLGSLRLCPIPGGGTTRPRGRREGALSCGGLATGVRRVPRQPHARPRVGLLELRDGSRARYIHMAYTGGDRDTILQRAGTFADYRSPTVVTDDFDAAKQLALARAREANPVEVGRPASAGVGSGVGAGPTGVRGLAVARADAAAASGG